MLALILLLQSSEVAANRFTSFQCIGGSQVFKTESLVQASVKVFPLNNPEFRTCHFKNICYVNGSLTFFSRYKDDDVPSDYLPEGFGGNIYHTGYLRGFTLPIKTFHGPIPREIPFHAIDVTFLDSNSWSFNYGHYIIDNVIPTYVAANLFGLPWEDSQQLIETNCRLFSTLEPAFADRLITYNRSMGTYRQACLNKLDKLYHYFFNNAPIYLDHYESEKKDVCFHHLVGGHGSTFGLKSIDLSRGIVLKGFRDSVLKRTKVELLPQEDLILVGLRVPGSAGGAIIHDLCNQVKTAYASIDPSKLRRVYAVDCFLPSDVSFLDEIKQVNRAKVLITVHGTISYLSLFSRDGTQQISIANPAELKENQILPYGTHFNILYLTWDRMSELPKVLFHSLTNSEAYYFD